MVISKWSSKVPLNPLLKVEIKEVREAKAVKAAAKVTSPTTMTTTTSSTEIIEWDHYSNKKNQVHPQNQDLLCLAVRILSASSD